MDPLTTRLRQIEARLERILVSGWRNAAPEATDLAGEADALAALGLVGLADRLRAVAASAGGADALRRIALAASAARLTRARLAESPTPADWARLTTPPHRRRAAATAFLPVARLALSDGETWACVRLGNNGFAMELLLIDPPPLPSPPPEPAPTTVSFAKRFLGRKPTDEPQPPWLRRPIRGHPRWRATHPLGASGEVRRYRLVDPAWADPAAHADRLAAFRKQLILSAIGDDRSLLGPLVCVQLLDPAEADTYVWPDPAPAALFRSLPDRVWSIIWTVDHRAPLTAPLALLTPGDTRHDPSLTHFAPGLPTDRLPT